MVSRRDGLGRMFEMRWWGWGGGGGERGHLKTFFSEQLQRGKGKNYLYGGRRSEGCCHPCPPPIKNGLYHKG